MFLFGKKKSKDDQPAKKEEPKEQHVICPQCFLDYTVSQIEEAGGICPSCKATIDLTKIPRGSI